MISSYLSVLFTCLTSSILVAKLSRIEESLAVGLSSSSSTPCISAVLLSSVDSKLYKYYFINIYTCTCIYAYLHLFMCIYIHTQKNCVVSCTLFLHISFCLLKILTCAYNCTIKSILLVCT